MTATTRITFRRPRYVEWLKKRRQTRHEDNTWNRKFFRRHDEGVWRTGNENYIAPRSMNRRHEQRMPILSPILLHTSRRTTDLLLSQRENSLVSKLSSFMTTFRILLGSVMLKVPCESKFKRKIVNFQLCRRLEKVFGFWQLDDRTQNVPIFLFWMAPFFKLHYIHVSDHPPWLSGQKCSCWWRREV